MGTKRAYSIRRRMKYAKCAIKVDPNQFSDPLAPTVAAADAVWLPAVTV